MNDFTKEELYSLESTIKNMRLYSGIDLWDEELLIKIQSLIDNYCEHEFHPVIGSFQIDSCHKCMKVK